eukprot:1141651-Pelagomonas_calceolata.AAC.5
MVTDAAQQAEGIPILHMKLVLHLVDDLQLLGVPVKNQGSSSPPLGPPGVKQQRRASSAASPAGKSMEKVSSLHSAN